MENNNTIEITTLPGYALNHILHASYFCRLCGLIERFDRKTYKNMSLAHSAFATNAILSAVSFLEAIINELFIYTVEEWENYQEQLDEETKSRLSKWWKEQDERGFSII
ncbi:MAG: hypothetical protein KAX49_14290 [Halanaerobiales bacterium]|nr:hypothetical protein [Halanaerobiales bacterium]